VQLYVDFLQPGVGYDVVKLRDIRIGSVNVNHDGLSGERRVFQRLSEICAVVWS